MLYADYEYYEKNYLGTLSEEFFKPLIVKASREIDKNINTRLTQDKINNLSEEAQDQLKYTACALVDLLNQKEQSTNKKVSSISIDGVSKSFNIISNTDYISNKKEILACLPHELTCYV